MNHTCLQCQDPTVCCTAGACMMEKREFERRQGYVHPEEGTERAMRSAEPRRERACLTGEDLMKHFEAQLPDPAEIPVPPNLSDFTGIGNMDAFVAAKAHYVVLLERHATYLRSCCIAGFYEDEVPQFEQGLPHHEIQSLVTAEEVQGYVNKIKDLSKEVNDHEKSFNLRWAADQRAIKRWQEATGNSNIWPDHADLCVWLMEQLENAKTGQ